MKNTHLILFSLVLSVLLPSCKKDPPPSTLCETCDCKPLGDTGPFGDFYFRDLRRRAPCFNPNNADELVYIRETDSVYARELVLFNVKTKKEEVLVSNRVIADVPTWGKNNIIMYTGMDFKIRGYDMNLHQERIMLDLSFCQYPAWTSDSTFICYFTYNLSLPYYVLTYNVNSHRVDTFKNHLIKLPSVNHEGKIAYTAPYGDANLMLYDKDLKSSPLFLADYYGHNEITGLCFDGSGKDVFYTTIHEGLYKINIETLQRQKIRNSCTSKTYSIISIAPDNSRMAVEKTDFSLYNGLGAWCVLDIYLMDLDGKHEVLLE